MKSPTLLKSAYRGLFDNPYFIKRTRTHLRGFKFHLIITLYILGIGALLSFIYFQMLYPRHHYGGSSPAEEAAETARTLFLVIMSTQAAILCFLGALLPAASIVSEKEKQTFEMLKLSTRSPYVLVAGEVLASVTYQSLLIFASLPLVGVVFLIGGVSPGELLTLYLALFLTSLFYSTFGIMLACSQDKIARTLVSVLGGVFGISILFGYLLANDASRLLACASPQILFMNIIEPTALPVTFFGLHLPALPLVVILSLLACMLMGILAGRKVFDPTNRALSTPQISMMIFLMLFLIMASSWGNSKGFLMILLSWLVLMIIYILNQTTHFQDRMPREQKIRPDDWRLFTVYLLLGLAAIMLWGESLGLHPLHPVSLYSAVTLLIVLASYRSLAELMSYFDKDRSKVIRNTLFVVLLILILPPLIGGIGLQFGQEPEWSGETAYEPIWRCLISLNPLTGILELLSRLGHYSVQKQWEPYRTFADPWGICCGFHLAIFILATIESKHLQSKKAAPEVLVPLPTEI